MRAKQHSSNRISIIAAACGVIVLLFATSQIWLGIFPDSIVYYREFHEARQIIAKLEDYRAKNTSYPKDLCQIKVPCGEGTTLWYHKDGEDYTIGFGAPTYGFFSTLIYESSEKKWRVDSD